MEATSVGLNGGNKKDVEGQSEPARSKEDAPQDNRAGPMDEDDDEEEEAKNDETVPSRPFYWVQLDDGKGTSSSTALPFRMVSVEQNNSAENDDYYMYDEEEEEEEDEDKHVQFSMGTLLTGSGFIVRELTGFSRESFDSAASVERSANSPRSPGAASQSPNISPRSPRSPMFPRSPGARARRALKIQQPTNSEQSRPSPRPTSPSARFITTSPRGKAGVVMKEVTLFQWVPEVEDEEVHVTTTKEGHFQVQVTRYKPDDDLGSSPKELPNLTQGKHVAFAGSSGPGHGVVKRRPTAFVLVSPEQDEDSDPSCVKFRSNTGPKSGAGKGEITRFQFVPKGDEDEEIKVSTSPEGHLQFAVTRYVRSEGDAKGGNADATQDASAAHPPVTFVRAPGAIQDEKHVGFAAPEEGGHGLVQRRPTAYIRRPAEEAAVAEDKEERHVGFAAPEEGGHGLVQRRPTAYIRRPAEEAAEAEDKEERHVGFAAPEEGGHGLVQRRPTAYIRHPPEEAAVAEDKGERHVGFAAPEEGGHGLVQRRPTAYIRHPPEEAAVAEDKGEKRVGFADPEEPGHGVVQRNLTAYIRRSPEEDEQKGDKQVGFVDDEEPGRGLVQRNLTAYVRHPPEETEPKGVQGEKRVGFADSEDSGHGLVQRRPTAYTSPMPEEDEQKGEKRVAFTDDEEPIHGLIQRNLTGYVHYTPPDAEQKAEKLKALPPIANIPVHTPSTSSTDGMLRLGSKKVSFGKLDLVRTPDVTTASALQTLSKASYGHVQLSPLCLMMEKDAVVKNYKLVASVSGNPEDHRPKPWIIRSGLFIDCSRVSLMAPLDVEGECLEEVTLELVTEEGGKSTTVGMAVLSLNALHAGNQSVNLRLFKEEDTIGELAMDICAINFGKIPGPDELRELIANTNLDHIPFIINDGDELNSRATSINSEDSQGPPPGLLDWTTAVEVQILKLTNLQPVVFGKLPDPVVEVSLMRTTGDTQSAEQEHVTTERQKTLNPAFGETFTLYLKDATGVDLRLQVKDNSDGTILGSAVLRVEHLRAGQTEPTLRLYRNQRRDPVGEAHIGLLVTKREPGINFLDQFMSLVLSSRKFTIDQCCDNPCSKSPSFIVAPAQMPVTSSLRPNPSSPQDPRGILPGQRMRSPAPVAITPPRPSATHPASPMRHIPDARSFSPISGSGRRCFASPQSRGSAAEDIAIAVTAALERGMLGRMQSTLTDIQAQLFATSSGSPQSSVQELRRSNTRLLEVVREAGTVLRAVKSAQDQLTATATQCCERWLQLSASDEQRSPALASEGSGTQKCHSEKDKLIDELIQGILGADMSKQCTEALEKVTEAEDDWELLFGCPKISLQNPSGPDTNANTQSA